MLGVLIANTNPGPLSSSLYNTLDATDKRKKKKKATEGRVRRRVCVGCVGRTEHSDTSLMNILKGPLLYGERKRNEDTGGA